VIDNVVVDTGPLVALLDKRDRYHAWTIERMANIRQPLFTCEAVLSETFFLLKNLPPSRTAVLNLLHQGALRVPFRLDEHLERLLKLLHKYRDVPISLADACRSFGVRTHVHQRSWIQWLITISSS